MSTAATLAHIEILASEPERAILFYAGVFGWNAVKWQPKEPPEPGFDSQYWTLTVKHGHESVAFGLRKRDANSQPQPESPVNAYLCTIQVRSLEETLNLVNEYGGFVTMEKQMIAPNTYVAGILDPEGNNLRIISTVTA